MVRRLRVLCPQEYDGLRMVVVGCTRCDTGWDRAAKRCTVYVGVEHLPLTPTHVPACPIAERCQHQMQVAPRPCAVRARGLVCESALVHAGMDPADAADHPDSFSASTIA